MTLDEINCQAINPAFAMLPKAWDTPAARVQVLATGGQESGFLFRRQMGDGPARSFWQMERGGGVRGVLEFKADGGKIATLARMVCVVREVRATPDAVWNAIEKDDVLAAAFARLLVRTDANPLPAIGQAALAWDYYVRTWNPGRPRKDTWAHHYAAACNFVVGGDA